MSCKHDLRNQGGIFKFQPWGFNNFMHISTLMIVWLTVFIIISFLFLLNWLNWFHVLVVLVVPVCRGAKCGGVSSAAGATGWISC